jgi:RNA methyltransferase, TrmH family
VIRSPDNRIIKLIRSLRQRKTRETERAFVVEGYRAVADAIAAGTVPRIVAIREGDVDVDLLEGLSETVKPQGVLAVFPIPNLPIPTVPDPLILVLDQIRDPGNLGTLVRTAAAAGVTAIYLTEGTVDPFNPKAVRSAVGAHFRAPIRWLTESEREQLTVTIPDRIVADALASTNYDEIDWTEPCAVIIGSEAHGSGRTGRELATGGARIPLANDVESLNAAAAGAIMLFEAARQRRVLSETNR